MPARCASLAARSRRSSFGSRRIRFAPKPGFGAGHGLGQISPIPAATNRKKVIEDYRGARGKPPALAQFESLARLRRATEIGRITVRRQRTHMRESDRSRRRSVG